MGVFFVFGLLLTSFHIGCGQPFLAPANSRSFPSVQRWMHRSWDAFPSLESSLSGPLQYQRELLTSSDVDNYLEINEMNPLAINTKPEETEMHLMDQAKRSAKHSIPGKRDSYLTMCHFKICNIGRKRRFV